MFALLLFLERNPKERKQVRGECVRERESKSERELASERVNENASPTLKTGASVAVGGAPPPSTQASWHALRGHEKLHDASSRSSKLFGVGVSVDATGVAVNAASRGRAKASHKKLYPHTHRLYPCRAAGKLESVTSAHDAHRSCAGRRASAGCASARVRLPDARSELASSVQPGERSVLNAPQCVERLNKKSDAYNK